MQLPLTDADTLFAELLQDLPSKTAQMACECKAFVQTKKLTLPISEFGLCSCGFLVHPL
jgi:hypothetical protein